MEYLIALVAICAALVVLERWRWMNAGRDEQMIIDAHEKQVLAVAHRALRGRNPLVSVSGTDDSLSRTWRTEATVGPIKGSGSSAKAEVLVARREDGRLAVRVHNDFRSDTLFGIPASPRAVHRSARAVGRVTKALTEAFPAAAEG